MTASLLHGRGEQGSDKGLTHAALSADYGDHILYAGKFMGILQHAPGRPILAGFLAACAVVRTIFAHWFRFLSDSFSEKKLLDGRFHPLFLS